MKKVILMLLIIALILPAAFAGGAKESKDAKAVRLGVTIEDFNDVFMRYLLDELTDEAGKSGAVVSAMDGRRDPSEQVRQVENFVVQKVDAIIIHVIDNTLAPEITRIATNAGIPLVYVNRKPDDADMKGDKVVAVASPEPVAGKWQAEFVVKKMGDTGNVVILMGSMGTAPQIGRTAGAKEVFAKYPGIKVTREQTANFQRSDAVTVMENWLASGDRIDAVVANNDEMAIGAVLALEEKGLKNKVIVTGVDATADAMEFIEKGRLDMTVFQNAGAQGRGAVQAALKLVKGEKVEKFVEIPFEPVTRDNYRNYKK